MVRRSISFGVLASLITVGLVASQPAQAESHRMKHKIGILAGVLGDPYPSIISGNVAYNVLDFLRVQAGYGTGSAAGITVNSLGIGVRALVPDWNFSPMVGVSFVSNTVTIDVSQFISAFNGFSVSGTTSSLYIPFGFDWQTEGGFNLGFGASLSTKVSQVLPYITIGWFFGS
ncbi:hypothetical protein K2X30_11105 [bacterium]|jgi:hypothetical protein|nr:hypothetical protein [bacterium]